MVCFLLKLDKRSGIEMKSHPIISVCIQVEPNALGIDFGRIEMTAEVVKLIRRLYSIVKKYNLAIIPTSAIPIKWYKAGQLQTARHTDTIDLCDGGSENYFMLFVDMYFFGDPDEDGLFSNGVYIRGHWDADLDDLTRKRLVEQADDQGDIHATSHSGESDLEARSRDVELKHGILQMRVRQPQCVPYIETALPWPDPFACWPAYSELCSHAHLRLPPVFFRARRSRQATDVLGMLFFVALKKCPDPNERCAIYTLAAAIIICPDEVELTQIVETDAPPIFNRSCELEPLGEWPLTDDYLVALGQICRDTGKHFERPNRKVRIRYKTLMGVLNVDRFNCNTIWTTHTSHTPNLALLYQDHMNNEAAKYWLNEHERLNRADHSRLILLAYGLDAVKRLFAGDEPWWVDMKEALEGIVWFDDDLSKM
jgi:hypothetical protein